MATPKLVTGDDIDLVVTLKKNNSTFAIDATATVTAALVNSTRTETYTLPITQDEAAVGADWANSLLIISFAEADTLPMTYQGSALLEIQVEDDVNSSGKTTFFSKVLIVNGQLP